MDINSKNNTGGVFSPGMSVMLYDYRISDGTMIPGVDAGGEAYLQLEGVLSAAMGETSNSDMAAFNSLMAGISSYARQSGGACIVHACGSDSSQSRQHLYIGRRAMESYMNVLDPSSQAMDLLVRALSVFRAAESAGTFGDGLPACCGAVYTAGPGCKCCDRDFEFGVGTYPDSDTELETDECCIGACPVKIALVGLAAVGVVCAVAAVWKRFRS